MATKLEELVPWAKDEARHGHEMALQEMPTEGKRGPVWLLRKTRPREGEREPEGLPQWGRCKPEARPRCPAVMQPERGRTRARFAARGTESGCPDHLEPWREAG